MSSVQLPMPHWLSAPLHELAELEVHLKIRAV
jgi:hypothetical protein